MNCQHIRAAVNAVFAMLLLKCCVRACGGLYGAMRAFSPNKLLNYMPPMGDLDVDMNAVV